MLLRSAIAEGVAYVDLEDDVASSIPRYGKSKRIVSIHDFRKTPDNLEEIHARLAGLDADIVKIATTANNTHDNLRDVAAHAAIQRADRGHLHGRHRHAVAHPGRGASALLSRSPRSTTSARSRRDSLASSK